MKRKLFLILALPLFVGLWWVSQRYDSLNVRAASAPTVKTFYPDAIQYGPAPSFVEPRAQLAVLEGDPLAATGDYTVRLKMPDGYRIAPHWHPRRENVTVISGIFKVGMGDHFDEASMMSFPGGQLCLSRSRDAPLRHGQRRGRR